MPITDLPPEEAELVDTTTAERDPDLPPVAEDAALVCGERLSEARILNYVDIANEHCAPEELADIRTQLREEMRNRGMGDPMEALGVMLLATTTVKDRAAWTHAAVSIRDEGRADRSAPTIDQPALDEESSSKGKALKKPKLGASWVKSIGTTVAAYELRCDGDVEVTPAMLQARAFIKPPSEVKDTPVYGWSQLADPLDTTFYCVPHVGDGVFLWGLRRDQVQGVPRTRLRMEAARQAAAEARDAGGKPSTVRAKELYEESLARWLREAMPATLVTPVTWHPKERRFLIHTASEKIAAAGAALIGACTRVDDVRPVVERLGHRNPAATDLRKPNGAGEGAADLGADFLLWLVGRAENGTGVLRLEDGARVEWWIENDVVLERDTADEKALKMKLGGAPTEGGTLYAALADGASIQSARIALRRDEQTWHVTFAGLAARSLGLPAMCVPDGTAESLDAAVVERLTLWRQADEMIAALRRAYAEARTSSWGQLVQALRRRLGVEIATRYAFDEATGQGVLFREMLPGQQEQLFEGHNAESPPPPPAPESRGRRGRGRKVGQPAAEA